MSTRGFLLSLILLAGCEPPSQPAPTAPPTPPPPVGCKADCDAKVLWIDTFASSLDAGARVAADRQGNVIVVGAFEETLDLGAPLTSVGGSDVVVAKLDPDGKVLWRKSFGSAGDDGPAGFGTDASGAIFVAGQMSGAVDFGGGPLPAAGPGSMFVIKLDAQGEHVWSRSFPGHEGSVQSFDELRVDPSGDVVVRGLLGNEPLDLGAGPIFPPVVADSVFLAKLRGPDGSAVWSRSVQNGRGLAVGPKGEIEITASFPATTLADGSLPEGAYLTKLDGDGATIWTVPLTPFSEDFFASSIAIDPAGRVVVGGMCHYDQRWCAAGYGEEGGFRFGTELGNASLQDAEVTIATGPSGESVAALLGFGAISSDGGFPFARKIGADGARRWSIDVKVPNQLALGVAIDGAGSVLLSGSLKGTIDLGTGAVPSGGVAGGIFVAKLAP